MDREAAQARLNRIRLFRAEVDALEHEGVVVLDEPQRRAVADYHRGLVADLANQFDLDRDETQRRMSLGMRIASLLGAIALSAAVFLLFYRFWGRFSTPAQVLILMAGPLVSLALTEVAHRFDRSQHFVFVAGVIACACIVLNVSVLGDIFAMTDSPNAFAVWAAFGLAVGYGYQLRLPVAVGIAAAMVFVVGAAMARLGIEWTSCVQRPEAFIPLCAAAIAAGAFAADAVGRHFAQSYRLVGLVVLMVALYALSLSNLFGNLSVLPFTDSTIRATYQVLGFVAAAAAIAAGLRYEFAEMTNIGAAGFIVFLYTRFYDWWWDWMPAYVFFFIVGAAALGMILVLRAARAMTARVTA
jgi:hypothetical protein